MQLNLSAEDVEMLKEILSNYLSDLRMEIADTDSMSFREEMKKREELLKRLLNDLEK
jgi:hypothetical protein